MGLPYYRLAKMQMMLAVPIAVSTQSELIASMMGPMHCIFNYLVIVAAQSRLLYQDDTNVIIQMLVKENKVAKPKRKGMYTSGFIAEGEHKVVLYFSGRAHAGENFDSIIAHREPSKAKVTRMADALSANSKHEALALEAKCNAHALDVSEVCSAPIPRPRCLSWIFMVESMILRKIARSKKWTIKPDSLTIKFTASH